MPKTIIKIKTWKCNCGYSQDFEPTQENQNLHFNNEKEFKLTNLKANECPSCGLKGLKGTMALETIPEKKITMTVMGEEDIEDEIAEIKERKLKGEKNNDPDISTLAKENAHRNKRKEDIRLAVIEAKKLE